MPLLWIIEHVEQVFLHVGQVGPPKFNKQPRRAVSEICTACHIFDDDYIVIWVLHYCNQRG